MSQVSVENYVWFLLKLGEVYGLKKHVLCYLFSHLRRSQRSTRKVSDRCTSCKLCGCYCLLILLQQTRWANATMKHTSSISHPPTRPSLSQFWKPDSFHTAGWIPLILDPNIPWDWESKAFIPVMPNTTTVAPPVLLFNTKNSSTCIFLSANFKLLVPLQVR